MNGTVGKRPTILRKAILLLSALVLLGGMGIAAAGQTLAQEEATFQTRARFLHANTDGAKVEVFLNGEGVLDEFQYGDISDWIDVDPGSVRLTITADRAGFNYAVFDAVYPVAAGNDINVIISDALVIGSAVDTSELRGNLARVRVVHASADTPTVDVNVVDSDISLAKDLRYGRNSEYVNIPAGTYDLEVLVSETGETALTVPGVTVEAGKVYDFVAMGTAGSEDKPLTVTPLVTDARVAEATPSS
jgi:hypothetical protein